MALTEEQKRKIKENRERALALKKRKAEERAAAEEAAAAKSTGLASQSPPNDEDSDEDHVELEDFEVGASQYVTKDEAMRKYCLPQGTLAVCSYVEKPNPRNKSWTPMRLYKRSEIRRRARERFGDLEGLVEERRNRNKKRFTNDMAETKDVFKKSKS